MNEKSQTYCKSCFKLIHKSIIEEGIILLNAFYKHNDNCEFYT